MCPEGSHRVFCLLHMSHILWACMLNVSATSIISLYRHASPCAALAVCLTTCVVPVAPLRVVLPHCCAICSHARCVRLPYNLRARTIICHTFVQVNMALGEPLLLSRTRWWPRASHTRHHCPDGHEWAVVAALHTTLVLMVAHTLIVLDAGAWARVGRDGSCKPLKIYGSWHFVTCMNHSLDCFVYLFVWFVLCGIICYIHV